MLSEKKQIIHYKVLMPLICISQLPLVCHIISVRIGCSHYDFNRLCVEIIVRQSPKGTDNLCCLLTFQTTIFKMQAWDKLIFIY